MGGSLRIARIAGIDIKLHITFFLIVLVGAWQGSSRGPGGALVGALLTLLLFVSVTLHELGHSLVAKAYGIPVRDITLTPLGGIAQLGARPRSPGQELLVALAGPAVNVVLALVMGLVAAWYWSPAALRAALASIFGAPSSGFALPTGLTVLAWLAVSNLVLFVFNLLPALPMDGGRVLRAVLSWPLGLERATRWAAAVGRVFAAGFFLVGVFGGNLVLALIGVFVFLGAGAELRSVRAEQMLGGVTARDAVNPYTPRFVPGTTLGEAMRAVVFTPYPAFAVEHFGRVLGVVTRDELQRGAEKLGPHGYVAGVMRREFPVIGADEPLEAARLQMNGALSTYVAVVDGELFLGLITELDLARSLGVATALRQRSAAGPVRATGW